MKRVNKQITIDAGGQKMVLTFNNIPTFIPDQMLVDLALGQYRKGEHAS